MQVRSRYGDCKAVSKQAITLIGEINEQRHRLRNDMSDATFCTWLAETITILEYSPEMVHLKQRLIDVGRSDEEVVDKVKEVRGILSSVVRRINSKLFGTGMVPASSLLNKGDIVVNQTLINTLTQSTTVDLNTLLQRVDDTKGISDENKEEAKPLVTKIWEFIKSGAKDSAVFWDLAARLGALGFNVHQILYG